MKLLCRPSRYLALYNHKAYWVRPPEGYERNKPMRLPESIAAVVGGLPYAREDIGMSGAGVLVYEDFVLKMRPEGGHDTSDTLVLRFLEGLLPVPKVIAQENLNGMDFLLMERLKGRMLTDASILEKPSLLIGCMAEALERLWAVPPEKVPFPRTLDVDLAYVAQRVENGSVNPSECEPETFGPGGFASPEALLNYLALVGWNPGDEREFFTLPELVEAFDIHRLNKSPGIFDVQKLTWFNAEYIRRMDPGKYLEAAAPWFDRVLAGKGIDYARLAELTQSRTEVFNQLPDMVAFLAELPDYDLELYTHKKMKTNPEVALSSLKLVRPVLEGLADWSEASLHDAVMAAIQEAGLKNGAVLWPLRIAIAGVANTPGGAFEIAALLGREETLRRLDIGLRRLENA